MTTETLTRPAPVETVTPLRPSEAMRLGCLTTRQGTMVLASGDRYACALGAMLIGYGFDRDRLHAENALDDVLPEGHPLLERFERVGRVEDWYHCPVRRCSRQSSDLEAAVIHLNDGHTWKRERIADWLEQEIGL